jgi:hypothetical protein
VSPAFNFYMRVLRPDGSPGAGVVLQQVDGTGRLRVFLNWQSYGVPQEALTALKDDLKALLGDAIDVDVPEPAVSLAAPDDRLEAFGALILRFRDDVGAAADA